MTDNDTPVYGTISIVGLGLIGGAIGIRAHEVNAATTIKALVRRREVIDLAEHLNATDVTTLDVEESVADADLVIIATSVSTIPNLLKKVAPYLKPGCTVTDVGSTKKILLERCAESLSERDDVFLVGSHPVSGTEKKGLLHCQGVVLPDHLCVITPVDGVPSEINGRVAEFWKRLGMTVMIMSAADHDRELSLASHVPHYVASALMAIQTRRSMTLSAGGLRDTTRIAQSDPPLWTEIAMENADAVVESMRLVADEINTAADLIEKKDTEAFQKWFAANHDKRKTGLDKQRPTVQRPNES